MRNKYFLLVAVCLLLSCCSVNNSLLPGDQQNEVISDQFLIGEQFHLNQGEVVDGNIVGIGSTLILESGSVVTGNVTLVGSTLTSSGTIQGDLNVFAGLSQLMNQATVEGDINQFFHKAILEKDVKVMGEINAFSFPNFPADQLASSAASVLEFLKPKRMLWFQLSRILAMSLLALLALLLFRKTTTSTAILLMAQPLASWGAGIFTALGVPIIAILLIITICLLPVGVLLLLVFVIFTLYGWLVLGLVFGKIFQDWLHTKWTLEIQCFLGTLVLGIIMSFLDWLPCIGWLLNFLLGCLGLGAVILNRFGIFKTREVSSIQVNTVNNEPPKSSMSPRQVEPVLRKKIKSKK